MMKRGLFQGEFLMKPKMLISGLCILLAVCLAIYFYAEWQKQRFDATLPVPPTEEQTGGHWHGDEWHADDAHDNGTGGELIPSVDWQPSTGRPVIELQARCN